MQQRRQHGVPQVQQKVCHRAQRQRQLLPQRLQMLLPQRGKQLAAVLQKGLQRFVPQGLQQRPDPLHSGLQPRRDGGRVHLPAFGKGAAQRVPRGAKRGKQAADMGEKSIPLRAQLLQRQLPRAERFGGVGLGGFCPAAARFGAARALQAVDLIKGRQTFLRLPRRFLQPCAQVRQHALCLAARRTHALQRRSQPLQGCLHLGGGGSGA